MAGVRPAREFVGATQQILVAVGAVLPHRCHQLIEGSRFARVGDGGHDDRVLLWSLYYGREDSETLERRARRTCWCGRIYVILPGEPGG